MSQCISGSWWDEYPDSGGGHRCTHVAMADGEFAGLFCAACSASIDGTGPRCDCPGCSRPLPIDEPAEGTDRMTRSPQTGDPE